ncbi:MAG: putative Molybdate ABC transporter, periplasmic binding protein [Nitrospira sp.]
MKLTRVLFLAAVLVSVSATSGYAFEQLVIAASPSMRLPVEALGRQFEATHPDVRVRLHLDSGLDLRRTIAGMENSTKGYFIGTGPIHLVAPGGDELITRLEQKYYVLPGTRRVYAEELLVMVVPESLVDAPTSFDALKNDGKLRIAVGDPEKTGLGQKTKQLLTRLGIWDDVRERLDEAADTRSVIDHVLNGQADAGILFGPDAARENQRLRVVAEAERNFITPVVHSMAMERYCPHRQLCAEFLEFIQSAQAQATLKGLGYASPVREQASQAH